MSSAVPLLRVEGISVRYRARAGLPGAHRHTVDALRDVSVALPAGGRLGIVGESGSGKSTLARVVLGLRAADAGRVFWDGQAVDYGDSARLRRLRREMQVVFQDPVGSLDPRMTAGAAVAEALQALAGPVPREVARARVLAALEEVGLAPAFAERYPHELSGGQCQRVAIARATVAKPRLLVCDEATSALDVSVQAQIVDLLRDLSVRHGMALLFISHNLGVVRHLCDTVAVLSRGRLVEQGSRDSLFTQPREAATRALLDAVPEPDPAVQRARVDAAARASDIPEHGAALAAVDSL